MSNGVTTNYMSNASILAWMETRTDSLYGKMRDAMDSANRRTDAEDAMNTIKAKINDLKTSGADAEGLRTDIQATLDEYKDVPEVAESLQPIADVLSAKHQTMLDNKARLIASGFVPDGYSNISDQLKQAIAEATTITISKENADDWSKALSDKVDVLSKQDQLGMINIQEFNAQLNQAKQTASALMDAADKSASAIINHIS